MAAATPRGERLSTPLDPREDAIRQLLLDPVLAHDVFFEDRHEHKSPKFHQEMLRDWHSETARILTIAFRGSAKSTRAEEAICIEAAALRTMNCVVIGESETRAAERLATVKHVFETNDALQNLFDVGPGDTWTDTRCTLSNGVMLQAYGREQSLRGVKHLDRRPDLIFIDDLEDEESVKTPQQRAKTRSWLTRTVLPALEPGGRIRMAATPLHPEALAMTLKRAKGSWLTRVYPAMYKGADGEWIATWPDRFPVDQLLAKWAEMTEIGESEAFVQEYLCEAVDPSVMVFSEDMMRVVPRQRSWHPVYAVYDPARTKSEHSATTGKVVASWIGARLVVWDASAKKMLPDEIVADIFEVDRTYNPVAIGFEEDGLNEWALQPIRARQVETGQIVPLRPLKAPRGKLDFIRGLQPYFKAGEVEFAQDLPELRNQLLGFPTGYIDAPNALAYMLRLKLGVPVYDNFRDELIVETVAVNPRAPLWLCLGSNGAAVTAQLAQMAQGQLSVIADWLAEGDPGSVLRDVVEEARLTALSSKGGTRAGAGAGLSGSPGLRLVVPRATYDSYQSIGLGLAARKLQRDVTRGGDPMAGREEIRALMRRSAHGAPALRISKDARWTLRALAGGFARDADKADPQNNAYSVLMEGLESFAALLRGGAGDSDTETQYAYTADGRRYISALATRRG